MDGTHFEETRSGERLEVLREIVAQLRAKADRAETLQMELDGLRAELDSGLGPHEWATRRIAAEVEPLVADRDRYRTERNRLADLILSYAAPGQTETLDPGERYREACEIVSEFAQVWAELEGIIRDNSDDPEV